jgi:membrane protein
MSKDQRHVRLTVFLGRMLNAEAMRRAVAGPGDGFTARDWIVVFQRVRKEAREDNIGLVAAGVAFWAILSIVPLLIGVLAVTALVSGPARVREQLGPLATILPRPVARSLTDQLSDAVGAMSGQGMTAGLVIGLLGVLWTCSRGFGALINGLHIMIDETDTRNVFHRRAIAFALAAGALVTTLGALWLVAAVPRIGLRDADVVVGFAVRCALLAAVAVIGLILLYRYGPDREHNDWHAVRWGAGIAMTCWALMSVILAVYTADTGGRSSTYGTLAGAAAIATWLYMSCYIVLLGAEINVEIDRLLTHRAAFRDQPPADPANAAPDPASAEVAPAPAGTAPGPAEAAPEPVEGAPQPATNPR